MNVGCLSIYLELYFISVLYFPVCKPCTSLVKFIAKYLILCDTTTNRIVFKISFLAFFFFFDQCIEITWHLCIDLVSCNTSEFIYSQVLGHVCVFVRIFKIQDHVSCKYRRLTSCFVFGIPFLSFSCLIVLAGTSGAPICCCTFFVGSSSPLIQSLYLI